MKDYESLQIEEMEKEICLIKGGDSITPPINTNKNEISLEGLEFWVNQGINENSGLFVSIDYITINIPFQYISQEYEEYILRDLIDVLRLKDLSCDSKYSYSDTQMITRCIKKYSNATTIVVNDSMRENEFLEMEYLTKIELKGSGCREFESRGGNWKELLMFAMSRRGYITRVDISIDDKKPYFTSRQLDRYFRKRHFKSIFDEFHEDSSLAATGDKDNKGWGYLFGTKNSATRLRVYDKKLEKIRRKEAIDINLNGWIRYELRYMFDKAKSIIYPLLNNIMELEYYGGELLKGCITLLEENKKDKNKSRWKPVRKWEKMLYDLQKSKVKVLECYKKESNIGSINNWYNRSCTKAFSIINLINDEQMVEIKRKQHEMIGLLKLNHVDLNMINKEREIKNLYKLDMNDIQNRIKELNKSISECNDIININMFRKEIENMFHANYDYLINGSKI